jgi:hypothetical protein
MKHEVRVMQGQGSSIINISSTYGHEGADGWPKSTWIEREETEPWDFLGLLSARRERPRRRRAANQRDELAPFQLIELHPMPLV